MWHCAQLPTLTTSTPLCASHAPVSRTHLALNPEYHVPPHLGPRSTPDDLTLETSEKWNCTVLFSMIRLQGPPRGSHCQDSFLPRPRSLQVQTGHEQGHGLSTQAVSPACWAMYRPDSCSRSTAGSHGAADRGQEAQACPLGHCPGPGPQSQAVSMSPLGYMGPHPTWTLPLSIGRGPPRSRALPHSTLYPAYREAHRDTTTLASEHQAGHQAAKAQPCTAMLGSH